ncbi:MAG: hypothetical protein WCH03_05420 [Flavobacteriia bacterium]
MKTKKPFLRLVALAALSLTTGNELFAQTNVGAACGCPAVGARTQDVTTAIKNYAQSLGKWTDLPASAYGGEITGDITLTCDKIWTINEKIYVASGATLTIQPGTVIKGNDAASLAAATALIIERGGKINASGTVDCPIIFTHINDPLNGTYLLNQIGKWGGVLLCGKATNNLKLSSNGPFVPGQSGKLAAADGLGVLEGFASSIPQDQFGASTSPTAPAGYALGTSPSGNFSFQGTPGSLQNLSNATVLKLTAAPVLNFGLIGLPISGTGISSGTTITASSDVNKTFTISSASTAILSGSYSVGVTKSDAGTTGNALGSSILTLAANNATIVSGMIVSGTGITAGTTVSSYNSSTFEVTLSAPSTSAMANTYTFTLPTFTGTGSCSTGVTAVTLGASNSSILVGMTVSGTGIASGTVVSAISGVTLTLSAATTAALSTTTLTFGYPSFTADDAVNGLGATKIKLTAASQTIAPGLTVSGTNIPNGATVTGVTVSSGTVQTFTISAPLNGTAGTVTFGGTYPSAGSTSYFPIIGTTSTASATSGNTSGQSTLTLAAANSAIVAGMYVSGVGVTPGTTVSTVSTTSITLSANSTASMLGNNYNFTVANNPGTPAGLGQDGYAYVNYSGQAVSATQQSFDDNDNSGVMTYVSIRHSGANLLVGSEINGLTLASVGRGTKIEHIEIVSCADDNIEIFGGTVNLKWCTTLFGNDDMFDYDLGWSGKAQFLFGMKGPHQTGTGALSPDGDNGIEADSDDSQSGNFPRSHPIIYNATLIGNAKAAASSDNSALAGIQAKEFTEGEIYNSIIANFATGLNIQQVYGGTSRSNAKGGDVWHNWKSGATPTATTTGTGTSGSNQLTVGIGTGIATGAIVYGTGVPSWTTVSSVSGTTVTLSANLTANATGNYTFFSTNGSTSAISTANIPNGSESFKVKCNKFIANTNVLRFDSKNSAIAGIAPQQSDLDQLLGTTSILDRNVSATSLDGFSGAFAMTQGTNTITTKNDVIPSITGGTLPSSCSSAVNDGFFSIANYSGAFNPSNTNKGSWLSDWTYSQVLNAATGLQACPTDINNDGVTNVSDFLIFSGQFGSSCN